MSKKVFTEQELEMLRENQYTYAVTPHTLSFTKAFKEHFWEEYQAGAVPRQILQDAGYPAHVLGKGRIWGIAHSIKKQHDTPQGLHEGPLPKAGRPGAAKAETTEGQLRQLQEEVQYLRQQIEFLKKISSARITGKQVNCS